MKKILHMPLVRFAGVGVLSTLIDFVVLNVLLKIGAGIYISGALGFFAGFSNGYLLNSRFVFKEQGQSQYIKYLLVSLGGLILTEIILHIGHVNFGWSENAAKLLAVIIVFFWNYGLSKAWAFKA